MCVALRVQDRFPHREMRCIVLYRLVLYGIVWYGSTSLPPMFGTYLFSSALLFMSSLSFGAGSWKPNWDSLSFWNDFYPPAVSLYWGYVSFSFFSSSFSLVWMASSCFVLSSLSLTCVASLAVGNTPTSHPETPDWTKTSKYKRRAELCRQSHHHTSDDWDRFIL